jgi:hypothetical protein
VDRCPVPDENELKELHGDKQQIYRIRMGENITDPAGGGNISYNKNGEIDLNLSGEKDFSLNQVMAHELKHAFQFLHGEMDFKTFNGNPGQFYDLNDEIEAFQRQNFFALPGDRVVDPVRTATERYKPLAERRRNRRSYSLLTEKEKRQYENMVKAGQRAIGSKRK